MIFDKATIEDIGVLTDLRIAYLNEDLGVISNENLELCGKGRDGYCFMCIFIDSGKAYESVIHYWEDRNCFKCLYEAGL